MHDGTGGTRNEALSTLLVNSLFDEEQKWKKDRREEREEKVGVETIPLELSFETFFERTSEVAENLKAILEKQAGGTQMIIQEKRVQEREGGKGEEEKKRVEKEHAIAYEKEKEQENCSEVSRSSREYLQVDLDCSSNEHSVQI